MDKKRRRAVEQGVPQMTQSEASDDVSASDDEPNSPAQPMESTPGVSDAAAAGATAAAAKKQSASAPAAPPLAFSADMGLLQLEVGCPRSAAHSVCSAQPATLGSRFGQTV